MNRPLTATRARVYTPSNRPSSRRIAVAFALVAALFAGRPAFAEGLPSEAVAAPAAAPKTAESAALPAVTQAPAASAQAPAAAVPAPASASVSAAPTTLGAPAAAPAAASAPCAAPEKSSLAFATVAGKPWRLNASFSPTRGFLSIGREFGMRYFSVGLGQLEYSTRDGFAFGPTLNFQRRYADPRMPYIGLTAAGSYSLKDNGTWDTPVFMPSLGKELQIKSMVLHAELYAATSLNKNFGDSWHPGAAVGIGLPF